MQYQAPINDLNFLLFDVLEVDEVQHLEGHEEATPDVIVAIMEQMGRFAAEVLQPTNKIGDAQGCTYDPETRQVSTPDGFKKAYQQFAQRGWSGLDAPTLYLANS